MLAQTIVRTTGINWESVLTIVSAVVVVMTAVLGVLTRYIAGKITGAIDRFRIEAFDPLEGRVTGVETQLGMRPRSRRGRRD